MLPNMLQSLGLLSVVTLVAVVFTAAISDLRCRKIRNWATYSGILLGFTIGGLTSGLTDGEAERFHQFGLVGFGDALAGAAVCFGSMMLAGLIGGFAGGDRKPASAAVAGRAAWLRAGLGGGDIKLACAIGALLGCQRGILALLCSCALALIAFALSRFQFMRTGTHWLGRRIAPSLVLPAEAVASRDVPKSLPMGPFFALGAVFTLLAGALR